MSKNTKNYNQNTKHSNQKTGATTNVDSILNDADKVQERLTKAQDDLAKAYETGNPQEIERLEAIVSKAKAEFDKLMEQIPQDVKDNAEQLDSNTKNEEENDMEVKENVNVEEGTIKMMENDPLKADGEKVNADDVKGAVASEMIANGEATKEQVEQANLSKEVNDTATKIADEINKVNETPKDEEKKPEMSEDEKLIEQFKKDNANANKEGDKPEDKKEDNKEQPKSKLIPKPWQRVSDDGKSLINVITFMGQKVDYSVGLKHLYRFPNLSVSDGSNRIVTAKFPKEDIKPVCERVEFKDYVINIDKYGNSAVCKLYDPDGGCMLEFVSLATVIDVLQDELNTEAECTISWGTIDQIIKHKRGLKSRIKSLDSNDEPARQRGGAKKDEPVNTTVEQEVATTDNKESENKETQQTQPA